MGLYALHLKLVLVVCTVAAAAAQSKAGCNSSCGNLTIPCPFGTSKECYIDKRFLINCTTTFSGDPIAYLTHSNIQVLNISLHTGESTVSATVSKHCYNSRYNTVWSAMWFEKFSISNTKNRFTVVGCDTYAYIKDLTESRFQTGCMLICNNKTIKFANGSCSAVRCCQTSFPKGIKNYNISIKSYNNYEDVRDFNPCGYAFLAQDGSFNFSPHQDLLNLRNRTEFPVVLNWAVDNQTCAEAQKDRSTYACKQNSKCEDSESGIGYLCKCEDGFQGNPYLSDPDTGCKDECEL